MPNLMMDIAKTFISNTSATATLAEIKDDASVIKDTFMSGARTVQETYRSMRSHGFRKITDWFKQRGDELGADSSLTDVSDEFDAGFQYGNDEQQNSESSQLDYDSMKDLVKGQVSEMYRIGGKQAEATAMSSSEIITNMNARSSEIISSLGKINSSLTDISSKLDKLIQIQMPKQKERDYQSGSGVYDSEGNISIGSVFKYIMDDSEAAQYYGMAKDMLSMAKELAEAGMSPGTIIGQVAHGAVGDKSIKALNGMSINEIGESIDDRVKNTTNTILRSLTNTEVFKKIFGRIDAGSKNQDYTDYVVNKYTKDPAVFDGITRKTIIDIIPGYLRKITESLTGQTWNISDYGTLTMNERTSQFTESAYDSLLYAGITSKDIKRITKNTSMNQDDVNKAQQALMAQYAWYFFSTDEKLTDEFFKNGGNIEINNDVIDILTQTQGGDKSYWASIVLFIVEKFSTDSTLRGNIIRNITATTQRADYRNTENAASIDNIEDIAELTDEGFKKYLTTQMQYMRGDNRSYKERIDAGEMKKEDMPKGAKETDRPSDEAIKRAKIERLKQSEIVNDQRMSLKEATATQTDYLLSIFEILNRGINVYPVKRKKPFERMNLLHAKSAEITQPQPIPDTSDILDESDIEYDIESSDDGSNESEEDKKQNPSTVENNDNTDDSENDFNKSNNKKFSDMMKTDSITDALKNIISSEINSTKSDAANVFAYASDSIRDNIGYKKFSEERQSEIDDIKKSLSAKSDDGDGAISEEDKEIANEVLAAMQTFSADGETSEDKTTLTKQASKIKDQKLRSRIDSLINSSYTRTAQKKPAESKIGKVLLWGFGLIKSFVSPLLSAGKTFFTLLGKSIAKPIIDSLKSSWQMITRGARNIKEGFFGTKEIVDEDGNVIQEGTNGLIQNILLRRKENEEIRKEKAMIRKGKAKLKEEEKERAKKRKTEEMPSMPSIEDELKKEKPEKEKTEKEKTEEEKNEKEKKHSIRDAFHNATTAISDKFTSTSFGQGFAEAFKKEETKTMKPKSLADKATSLISKAIQSPDGKIDGQDSVFTKMISIFEGWSEKFERALTNEKKEDVKPEMPSLEDASTVDVSVEDETDELSMPSIQLPANGDAAPDVSGLSKAVTGAGKKGIGFNIGKILGGMSSMLLGIGKAVITVIMSMEGFKKIMNIGMDILKKSLKPLNKAFNRIYRMLKPVVRTVTKLLKQIVTYIVDIVQSVIDVIQPIMEAIEPIISSLLDQLMPLLDIITELVDVIMVPLASAMKIVVVPLLETISNTLEIISGILKIGFGFTMMGIGGVISVLSGILKFASEGKTDPGAALYENGKALLTDGWNSIKSGITNQIALAANTLESLFSDNMYEDEPETDKKSNKITREIHGSAFDATYGSGDVMDTYGGNGSQASYGNYMNMKNRGCGPVALADAYARRTGNQVSPKQLATVMGSAGTYNTNMGTSVGGYIKSARAMGMNVTPGGVSARSLSSASPTNPITLIGSGNSFTTRNGNNHYMNVIKSDGNTAYVTNPMSGKIERKSVGGLVSGSVVGLYGSGDATYADGLGDDYMDAFEVLKSLVNNILSLFTGDSSIEAALEKENNKQSYNKAQIDTANMSEEEKQKIDARARELFEQEHGRMEGESDKDFEKRYEKYKQKYWAIAAAEAVRDKQQSSLNGEDSGMISILNSAIGDDEHEGSMTTFANSMIDSYNSVESGGLAKLMQSGNSNANLAGTKGPHFASDTGAVLWTDQYNPQVMQNDARKWSRNAPNTDYKLILAEFFQNTISPQIKMTAAYKKYLNPTDTDAVGSQGEPHTGADFTIGGNPEIHATTGGTITDIGTNDHFGNFIEITDVGGGRHIYAHLLEVPKFKVGDRIEGGDVIGHIGGADSSKIIMSSDGRDIMQSGEHLHYEIRDKDNTVLNPFTYFKYKSGGANSVSLSGADAMFRAASEVFTRAYETKGSPLIHNGGTVRNITFDDGFVIDEMPEHCTGSMGAIVKRMGYYTHPDGKPYSNTHQGEGYMGNDVATKWGVGTGVAKIYNRDGSLSKDWVTGPGTNWQPGDIMFNSTGDAHAHMPAFKSTNGVWLGFNGGQNASFANSVALGYHYLKNGSMPTDVENLQTEGNGYSQQVGALAGPMSYYVRYIGGPVNFGATTDNYTIPLSTYEGSIYEDISDQAAAQSEYVKSQISNDAISGVPEMYATDGWVYNKAGVKLAKWMYPYGNAGANAAFLSGHPDAIRMKVYIGKGSNAELRDVIIYDFKQTEAGRAYRNYLKNGTYKEYETTSSTVQTSKTSQPFIGPIKPLIYTDTSDEQKNNGTNVINNPITTSTSTHTTTSSKTVLDWKDQFEKTIPKSSSSPSDALNRDLTAIPGRKLTLDSKFGSGDEPIDLNGLLDDVNYQDAGISPIIVNRYDTPVDTESDIQAILTNTYNIKSEKIESILENMLTLMKEKNQRRKDRQLTGTPKKSQPESFSNTDIPRQVERLSIG